MDILIFSILTNFVYYCSGYIVQSHTKFQDNSNFFTFFLGIIVISFVGLFLNFFLPLSQLINSLIYILVIIIFFVKNKFNINKKTLIFLIFSSSITFLLIIYSNVNRPDAGLYHLPYISILNENKIFFGISNIHFRFGHVSIMQYLSAINNNYLFLNNGISIPLASIVSFFYLYFLYDAWKILNDNNYIEIDKIFSLLILIYIAFKITRYSGFGNDAVGHLSFFYLISCVLKNQLNKININKILLISIFIFINKPTLGIVFLIPATIFLIQNNLKLIKVLNQIFSIPFLFLILWLIKNLVTSGCIIYPIKASCMEKLAWTNIEQIKNVQIESQAWSKGWPDRINKKISMEEFNQNFSWIKAWQQKHMKYIIKILISYILILLVIFVSIKIGLKSKISVNKDKDLSSRLWLTTVICLIGIFSFFLIFPIYRYGYSYIITFISLIFILLIKNNIKHKKEIFIFKLFIILSVVAFFAKQSQKIIINNNYDMWPNIYTFNKNFKSKINTKQKIQINGSFYYYANKGDNLCMYSKSPCTSYLVGKNINHLKKFGYSIFVVN